MNTQKGDNNMPEGKKKITENAIREENQEDTEFPSNSNKTKNRVNYSDTKNSVDKSKRPIKKVISGKVKTQKKSIWRTLKDGIFGDDTRSVGDYIMQDILIPTAKSFIFDTIAGSLEMRLFGTNRGRILNRSTGKAPTNYSNMYSSLNRNNIQERSVSQQNRARHNFDDIVIPTRAEAEELLSFLSDYMYEYGQVTVADFYDAVGITNTNPQDHKWGWADLRGAKPIRVRDGYLINLPRTQPLE